MAWFAGHTGLDIWLRQAYRCLGSVPVAGSRLIQPPKRPLGVAVALKVTEELPALDKTMV